MMMPYRVAGLKKPIPQWQLSLVTMVCPPSYWMWTWRMRANVPEMCSCYDSKPSQGEEDGKTAPYLHLKTSLSSLGSATLSRTNCFQCSLIDKAQNPAIQGTVSICIMWQYRPRTEPWAYESKGVLTDNLLNTPTTSQNLFGATIASMQNTCEE